MRWRVVGTVCWKQEDAQRHGGCEVQGHADGRSTECKRKAKQSVDRGTDVLYCTRVSGPAMGQAGNGICKYRLIGQRMPAAIKEDKRKVGERRHKRQTECVGCLNWIRSGRGW